MSVKDQGVDKSRHRYQVIPRTLTFITNGDDVLLLKGAPDKRIWANLLNGVGGHIERGETVLESARREIAEEVGLEDLHDVRLCGIVNVATDDEHLGILFFIFRARSDSRDVTTTYEGTPTWVNWRQIPPETLVEDLPILLPRVLDMADEDAPFFARYWYDEHDQLHIEFT